MYILVFIYKQPCILEYTNSHSRCRVKQCAIKYRYNEYVSQDWTIYWYMVFVLYCIYIHA